MKILSKKDECFIHVVFWVLYVLYFNIEESKSLDSFSLNVKTISLFTVTWFIVVLSTFYFQYLVILPWVFDKAVWVRLFFSVLLVAAFFIVFRFFVEQQLSKWLFNAWNYPNSTNMYFYLYENAFYGIIVYFFCIVIWLIVRFVRLLQVSKAILEEKQKAEIKFLKAQINPHFVFNTLNNIYSMVHFGSDRSLSAIEKLSNIMRFTTYEAQKDLILLEDELEYIKSFIELEQLRLTDAETVKLEIVDTFNHIEIPPYLLSPLVENALKHGVKPINIKLNVSDKELVLNVSNKIGTKKKDGYAGVGLENLRKRLEIYYSKKHVLNETVSEGVFHIELKIILG